MPEQFDNEYGEASAVNAEAFNALFSSVPAHRRDIIHELEKLIRHIARCHVRFRSLPDKQDVCGVTLIFVIDLLDKKPRADGGPRAGFDPANGTAYNYFYCVIRRHMIHEANRIHQHENLGDADGTVSFHDIQGLAPQDATGIARSSSVRHWKTYRLDDPTSRRRVEKYINVSIRKAQAAGDRMSKPEQAAIRVFVQGLLQTRRALLGA